MAPTLHGMDEAGAETAGGVRGSVTGQGHEVLLGSDCHPAITDQEARRTPLDQGRQTLESDQHPDQAQNQNNHTQATGHHSIDPGHQASTAPGAQAEAGHQQNLPSWPQPTTLTKQNQLKAKAEHPPKIEQAAATLKNQNQNWTTKNQENQHQSQNLKATQTHLR